MSLAKIIEFCSLKEDDKKDNCKTITIPYAYSDESIPVVYGYSDFTKEDYIIVHNSIVNYYKSHSVPGNVSLLVDDVIKKARHLSLTLLNPKDLGKYFSPNTLRSKNLVISANNAINEYDAKINNKTDIIDNRRSKIIDFTIDTLIIQNPTLWDDGNENSCLLNLLDFIKKNEPITENQMLYFQKDGQSQEYYKKLTDMKAELGYYNSQYLAKYFFDIIIKLYESYSQENNNLGDDSNDNDAGADGDTVIIADACGALYGSILGPFGSIVYCALFSVIENNR